MKTPDLKKTNTLLNLISHQPDIIKNYLYATDPFEAKYQLLINSNEGVGVKEHYNDSKVSIGYPNDMDDIYENIKEYSLNEERKILIVFDDTIADMFSNKKAVFFFYCTVLFCCTKNIKLNSTYCFIMRVPSK